MSIKLNLQSYFTFLFIFLPLSLVIGTLISEIVLLTICISFIFIVFKKKNVNFVFFNLEKKIFFFLYFYLLINSFFASDFSLSFERNFFFLRFIIFVFAVEYLLNNKLLDINKVFKFWSIFLLIFIFDLFYEYIFNKNIVGNISSLEGRLSGFMGKELKSGHIILGFSFLIISFFLPRYQIIIFSLGIPIILIISFLIGERANFFKLFLIFFLFFIIYKEFSIKKKIIFFTLLIIILFFLKSFFLKLNHRYDVNSFFSANNSNIEKNFYNYYQLYKSSQYGEHYLTTIEILKNNLYFGVGNKNFRNECKKYQKKLIEFENTKGIGCSTHPHQVYYELLSEHGIIGTMIIILCFLSILFLNLNKNKKINYVKLSCLLYIFVSFLPIIPSGSFFTSFGATIFWLNFALFRSYKN